MHPIMNLRELIFFVGLKDLLEQPEFDYMETIIGGDHNCVLDNSLDRQNCTSTSDIGRST